MAQKVCTIFVVLCVNCIFAGDSESNGENVLEKDELLFAHVIFRHGDRTILKPYPNDIYKDAKFWTEGFGQLTKQGKRRHFELGKYLRKRYYNLLGDGKYSADKVYVRSSDYDRTITSASANLAGWFPPENDQNFTDELQWIPILIHTIPLKYDHIIGLERPCAKYDKTLHALFESPEFLAAQHKVDRYIQLIKDNSGINNATITDIYMVWDALRVEYLQNLTMPSWVEESEMMKPESEMNAFFNYTFKVLSLTKEMKMLKSGYLIKEMFERFKQKAQHKLQPNRSLWIYSGHDITISHFLNSLNLFDPPHIPPYASAILFELYKSKDEFYVQLFYKNTTAEYLPPMNITGCGTKCSLDKLYDLLFEKGIIPTRDFETECQLSLSTEQVSGDKSAFWSNDLIGPIICTVIVVISTIYGWQKPIPIDNS